MLRRFAGDRRVARLDSPLKDPKPKYVTIADRYDGKRLNSPNDAVVHSNGAIYFTDPPYGLEKNVDDPAKELPFQGVYRIAPDGNLQTVIAAPVVVGVALRNNTIAVASQNAVYQLSL